MIYVWRAYDFKTKIDDPLDEPDPVIYLRDGIYRIAHFQK
jgi:hypothetical protein